MVVDSIADIMSHEDKDFCKYGHLAITILFETASLALRSQMDAARLPFFEYLAGKGILNFLNLVFFSNSIYLQSHLEIH